MFHVTPEGEKYKKGINWWRAPGWVRLVFFCGDCRLYFRLRWRGGLRLFCHWDLRRNEEPARTFVWTGSEFVPCSDEAEESAAQRLADETSGAWEQWQREANSKEVKEAQVRYFREQRERCLELEKAGLTPAEIWRALHPDEK